jgi:uncharacterized protein (UPF0333 family)
MNKEALFLFLILLLGLVLCSFLGGTNCSREGYTTSSTTNNTANATYKKDKYKYKYNHNYDNYNNYI